ncbi:MAG: OmpH family outer membrane protein [Terracidiphilus sp.]|jgi:outer membrane protein
MKCLHGIAFLLASGSILSAAAQTSPAPAAVAPAVPAKIAVIAFQVAVSQSNEFQRDLADLQKKFDPRRQQLKAMGDEIGSLQKQLQTQGDRLSPVERAARGKTIDEKKKKAQRSVDEAKNDFQQEMQKNFSAIASKVGPMLIDYAKQQGYTLVLDVSQRQQTPPLVIYAGNSDDITKAVLDAYNLKSGVLAPPAQPAAGQAPAQPPATPGIMKAVPPAH